jgi:hypothetical protein
MSESILIDYITLPSPPAPLPAEVPLEAVLPGAVEEAMADIQLLIDRWERIADGPDYHARTALAIIRAALTATIKPTLTVAPTTKVTREWVSWFVKTLFDMKMRGVTFPVEGAAETMLQSVGIEVEP